MNTECRISPSSGQLSSLDPDALGDLTYGMYLLSARRDGYDNACIVNTVQQVTREPLMVSVCINRGSLTGDMILDTGEIGVSVLSEAAPFSLYERFGYRSGRAGNKFDGFPSARHADGLLYADDVSVASLSCHVVRTVDLGTHTLFIARLTAASRTSGVPATYTYYQTTVKPKSPAAGNVSDGIQPGSAPVWVCRVCGYVYDEAREKTPFSALPAEWRCPVCHHPPADFSLK